MMFPSLLTRSIYYASKVACIEVSYKDSKFTSNFWKVLFEGFGTSLNMSTTYHSQIDVQTKRVNQVIEYMLRMYVMD